MFPAGAAFRQIFFGKIAGTTNVMTPNRLFEDWLEGRASLGAAGGWTAEEMRLVADTGYALAEQGRHDEAVAIFEGLAVLAPATAYFQSALGALWLRKGEPERALEHLEALLAALELPPRTPREGPAPALVRARALLAQLTP